jgi:hypothetical protein
VPDLDRFVSENDLHDGEAVAFSGGDVEFESPGGSANCGEGAPVRFGDRQGGFLMPGRVRRRGIKCVGGPVTSGVFPIFWTPI